MIPRFSAHHPSWGSTSTNSRRIALAEAVNSSDLILMKGGRATYFGHQGAPSVLDLTCVSPDVECYWSLDADTGGSDHLTTFIRLPQLGVVPCNVHHVTNWDLFRHH